MAEQKRRTAVELVAVRVLQTLMLREGAKIRAARLRRRWTQRELGRRSALSQQTISQIELGDGATLSLAAWQRVALALGLALNVQLGRDVLEEPRDAGHLGIQELLLRLGRAIGLTRRFELTTKPSDPTRSCTRSRCAGSSAIPDAIASSSPATRKCSRAAFQRRHAPGLPRSRPAPLLRLAAA